MNARFHRYWAGAILCQTPPAQAATVAITMNVPTPSHDDVYNFAGASNDVADVSARGHLCSVFNFGDAV